MKQIGTTSTGHALVEIASATAVAIVAALKQMGEALTTLDNLLTLDSKKPPALTTSTPKPSAPTPRKTAPAKAAKTREERDIAGRPTRPCVGCGKAFEPWRKDQKRCSKCSAAGKSSKAKGAVTPAKAIAQAKKYVDALPATPPTDRLEAIRAADARARLKRAGIEVPAAVFGGDSGIAQASDEDIAAVRGKGGAEE